MKNAIKIGITCVIIIACIVVVSIYVHNQGTDSESIYISELLVYKDGKEYEILVDKNTKETYLRTDEDKELCFMYPREGKSRLPIPDIDKIDGINIIEDKETILEYTYNVSYSDSFKYVKYLMDNGYSILMYAVNSQYFECFLKNSGGIKRLIIFSDTLMVCDLYDNASIPSVVSYFKTYDYNGKISSKVSSYENGGKT